jgi:hypothetical protein
MRNKKTWLIIKGLLILLFTLMILLSPTDDTFRKWLRFSMLVIFVISFLIDLRNYKNK